MFVAGGATIVSFLVLLSMVKTKIGEFKGKRTVFFTRTFLHVRLVSSMGRLFLVIHISLKQWIFKKMQCLFRIIAHSVIANH